MPRKKSIDIQKVSATKLESFVSCPYKYYLKYIRRTDRRAPATTHMIFGILIHKVLEEFIRYVTSKPLNPDIAKMRVDLQQEMYRLLLLKSRELLQNHPKLFQYLNLTVDMIYNNYLFTYIDWFFSNQLYSQRLSAEREFNIPILDVARTLPQDQLHPNWQQYANTILNGKIDLTIYPDVVVDYKTQPYPPHLQRLLGSFQTNLYTLIEDKDMTFVYLYVKKPLQAKTIKILRDGRIDKFNSLISALDLLMNPSGYKKNPKSCHYCIYYKMCYGIK